MLVQKINLFGFNINVNKFNMHDIVYVVVPAEVSGYVDFKKVCKGIVSGVKVNLQENPEEGLSCSYYSYRILMDLTCTRFFDEVEVFSTLEEAEAHHSKMEAIYDNSSEKKIEIYKNVLIEVEKQLEAEEKNEEPISKINFAGYEINEPVYSANEEVYIYLNNDGLNNPNQVPVFKATVEGIKGIIFSDSHNENSSFNPSYIVLPEDEFETVHVQSGYIFKHKSNALLKASEEIRAKLSKLGYNLSIES